MLVTLSGIITDFKSLHWLNALSQMIMVPVDGFPVLQIAIYWFSSVPLTLFLGDLRLAYISNF
jgi:hypothetical protein